MPGVYSESIIEKQHYGDVIRNTRRWDNEQKINNDLSLSNQFSILANDFAIASVGSMRYIKWNGVLWKITNVDIQRPRIIITVGGVYNANTG